jgi:hypothetical protein
MLQQERGDRSVKNDIVEQLVRELRDALLRDPECRPAVIKWATNFINHDRERTGILQGMFGDDVAL